MYDSPGGGSGLEGKPGVSRIPRLPVTPLILAAALLFTTYLAITTGSKYLHDVSLRGDKAALQREIDQLDRDERRLTAVRDYLQSDEYIELVARRILGLVRPGETLVVVSSSSEAPPPEPTAVVRGDRPWWEDLFGEPPSGATPSAGD